MVIDVMQSAATLAAEQATQALLTLIQKRHSTRGPFNPDRAVTTQQVKLIQSMPIVSADVLCI